MLDGNGKLEGWFQSKFGKQPVFLYQKLLGVVNCPLQRVGRGPLVHVYRCERSVSVHRCEKRLADPNPQRYAFLQSWGKFIQCWLMDGPWIETYFSQRIPRFRGHPPLHRLLALCPGSGARSLRTLGRYQRYPWPFRSFWQGTNHERLQGSSQMF